MTRRLVFLALCLSGSISHADMIGRYINISNNIPKMEMKADPEAQVWARSARNIINLTTETIAETLLLTNATASQRGAPLFCLPGRVELNAFFINQLVLKTYRDISSPPSEKDSMTVSQVALLGMMQQYPCQTAATPSIEKGPSAMMGASNKAGAMAHVSSNEALTTLLLNKDESGA